MPLLVSVFFSSLQAQEPRIMILDAIYANDSYLFRYKRSHIVCKPYGVWTFDQALRRDDISSSCKKVLADFIAHNPKLYYFAHYNLHLEQGYRVEKKKGECIIYPGSKRTLSEMLLAEGIAIKQPNFIDEEFRYRFFQAQATAKIHKRGIWKDAKISKCMSEFFKE